jgi:hypothetical protein
LACRSSAASFRFVALDYLEGKISMMARRVLCGAAGAATLVAVTLAMASSADAACASRHYIGEARGLFYTTTGISARSDWRGQVRRREGYEFGFWSRAQNRSTRCYRPEGGGRWYCRARARPCDG